MGGISILSSVFIFIIGLFALITVVIFIIDISQTRDAIRRNYPVVGRFRYLFTSLGEFFRQYFFAMDREEMPFNRAQRDWIAKSSKKINNTVAFGSTQSLLIPGTVIFIPCAFPKLDTGNKAAPAVVFGENGANPYPCLSLYNISAMSFGALSVPAIKALSSGAKKANCWLNTGEGGLAPYHLEGGCDIVFQIGTAKYGVRDEKGAFDPEKLTTLAANPQIKMIEIKLSQGAKPGKGGILPAVKVTAEIAQIRGIPEGEASISPNRHLDIDNVDELLDFIQRVRDASQLPTGFKAVIGCYKWLEELCEKVKQRGLDSAPDFITIDSGDGGTGAAPMPLMDSVGLSIKESLPAVVDLLKKHQLHGRIKIIASGKLVTPSEVAWAYCAGADVVQSARGFMFALGCIQSLKCNKNTCPTGITTHKRSLQKGLNPAEKSERVKNFVEKIHYGSNLIAHSCGVDHPRALTRDHCRIVQPNGQSVLLSKLS